MRTESALLLFLLSFLLFEGSDSALEALVHGCRIDGGRFILLLGFWVYIWGHTIGSMGVVGVHMGVGVVMAVIMIWIWSWYGRCGAWSIFRWARGRIRCNVHSTNVMVRSKPRSHHTDSVSSHLILGFSLHNIGLFYSTPRSIYRDYNNLCI